MTKVKKPPATLFLVFADGEFQSQTETYDEAKSKAIELLEDSKGDVKIFEVSRAWAVEYPEEPDPDIYSMPLENVNL